jgi:hypothetical protein
MFAREVGGQHRTSPLELPKETSNGDATSGYVENFTLPHSGHAKPPCLQGSSHLSISFDISLKLRRPEGSIAFGSGRASAAMAMPETAVHKHSETLAEIHEVR